MVQPVNFGAQGFNFDAPQVMGQIEQMKSMKANREKGEMDMDQQKRIQRIQQRMQDKLAKDPNADLSHDYALMSTMDPKFTDEIKDFNKEMDDDQQRILFQSAYEINQLLGKDMEDEAVNSLVQRNELLKAAGRDSKHTQRALDVYEKYGKDGLARALEVTIDTGIQAGFLEGMNPKDWETYAPRYDENREEYIPRINPRTGEVRREYTGAKKAVDELDVSSRVEQSLIKWDGQSFDADKQSGEAEKLAAQFGALEQDKVKGGVLASIERKAKELAGLEDEESMVRKNATRLMNSQIINNLPTGVASDRDVALIKAGYPSDVTNPSLMKEYMGAMSRVLKAEAQYFRLKSRFAEATGGINRARADADIDGVPIRKGESIESYIERHNAATKSKTPADTGGGSKVVDWNSLGGGQ